MTNPNGTLREPLPNPKKEFRAIPVPVPVPATSPSTFTITSTAPATTPTVAQLPSGGRVDLAACVTATSLRRDDSTTTPTPAAHVTPKENADV